MKIIKREEFTKIKELFSTIHLDFTYIFDPIVTEIVPLKKFYDAEVKHQDYYNRNGFAGYCRVVIDPKIKKLRERYADKLKKDAILR